MNSLKANINGVDKKLDVAPKIKNGTTYLPMRFLAETLGLEVGYYNQYPFYNYPLLWVETLSTHEKEKALVSKEEALTSVKKQLKDHLERWAKENPDQVSQAFQKERLDGFNSITYKGEFSRYWILSNGFDDELYATLLVDRYTGEVFYARGLITSYWIGLLDYDGFYSMYFAG